MGPILLYSELLQTNLGTETANKHLKNIEQSIVEARNILSALQIFVRKKRGAKPHVRVDQEINELLNVLKFQFDLEHRKPKEDYQQQKVLRKAKQPPR
jgi:C4-dicarboxylate-specific signal transduction histidine kinase